MHASVRHALTEFGLRVAELREKRALTQEQLAEIIGVSSRQLQRIEGGEVNASIGTLVQLARALGVPAGALLDAPRPGRQRRPGRPKGAK